MQNKKIKQTRFLNIEKRFKNNDFRAFFAKMENLGKKIKNHEKIKKNTVFIIMTF